MEQEVLKKLRFKDGLATVLNAPVGYDFGIGDGMDREYDFILLFVHNGEEADQWLPKVTPLLKDDAVFWISYPKQSAKMKTDLNRDLLAARVREQTPYRVVSNVAIDDKWSALRFRHEDKVKTGK